MASQKLVTTKLSSILAIVRGFTSSATAVVAGSDVSTSFSINLTHCLATDEGMVATATAPFTSTFFNNVSTPLTWTEGIRLNPDPVSDSNDEVLITREFYFGYPPTISDPGPPFYACSLFFLDASVIYVEPDDTPTALDWSKELPHNCVANFTRHLDSMAQKAGVQSN